MMQEYVERDKILKQMGFNSYWEYRKSSIYKKIRLKIYKKFQWRCFICDRVGNNIHHMKYSLEVLTGLTDQDMVVLCRFCHETIEFSDDKKTKLSLQKANEKMTILRNNHQEFIKENLIKILPDGLQRILIDNYHLGVGDTVQCVNGDIGMIDAVRSGRDYDKFCVCRRWRIRAEILYFIE